MKAIAEGYTLKELAMTEQHPSELYRMLQLTDLLINPGMVPSLIMKFVDAYGQAFVTEVPLKELEPAFQKLDHYRAKESMQQ